MRTRVFKSGNSLAVRIPKELGFGEAHEDVDVERVGHVLVIRRLTPGSLSAALSRFQAFPEGFMADGREPNPDRDREGW